MAVITVVYGTSPVVVAAAEKLVPIADTGMVSEGEYDSAPIVCPVDVVFPVNWIPIPGNRIKFN